MPDTLTSIGLQLRHARHVLRGRSVSLRGLVDPLDERLVFVVGCPRSGTTFLAGAIGSCPGLVDLGEVAPLKAAIPRLAAVEPALAAAEIRRILHLAGRLGLAGGLRGVEQTPETVFVVAAALRAYPRGSAVHILRDGRDVVCSLLERAWLSAAARGADDARQPYGAAARFWVEPERRDEFQAASDARRAAWAWRRYVEAARAASVPVHEIRYEELARDPAAVAEELAALLALPSSSLAEALGAVHGASIGRFRRDLTSEQLADVEAEAVELLDELGYR